MPKVPFLLKLALMFIPTIAPIWKWRVQSSVSGGTRRKALESGFPPGHFRLGETAGA